VNYFGYASKENWLDAFEKLSESYYKEFQEIYEELVNKKRRDNRGIIACHHRSKQQI
jgi:hypothetical protein